MEYWIDKNDVNNFTGDVEDETGDSIEDSTSYIRLSNIGQVSLLRVWIPLERLIDYRDN
jgi:hypothetical protein